MQANKRFKNLKSLGDLSRLMVETQKHLAHPFVERFFVEMKLVKTCSRNRIGDQLLSDCLICYIERDFLDMSPMKQ
ncbi:hypothetical protein AtNW77_Chr5g0116381 [Arabidopsis thaliana]